MKTAKQMRAGLVGEGEFIPYKKLHPDALLSTRLKNEATLKLKRAMGNVPMIRRERFTIDEVMSALSDAFPSPRTSRDCVVEENFKKNLSVRVETVGDRRGSSGRAEGSFSQP